VKVDECKLTNGASGSPPIPESVLEDSKKVQNVILLQKQVANDLVLSEDSDSESSSDSSMSSVAESKSKDEDDHDSGDDVAKPKETGGKIAMTNLLDHCENLEKNLNQSAMDIDGKCI
jgi:hypothetical protein